MIEKRKNIFSRSEAIITYGREERLYFDIHVHVTNPLIDLISYTRLQVIKVLDLREFDNTFSAYQKKGDETDGNRGDEITGGSTKSQKPKELALIDGRRAQNCTILLYNLKMTNADIHRALLSMDSAESLPKDMVEQVCPSNHYNDRFVNLP